MSQVYACMYFSILVSTNVLLFLDENEFNFGCRQVVVGLYQHQRFQSQMLKPLMLIPKMSIPIMLWGGYD